VHRGRQAAQEIGGKPSQSSHPTDYTVADGVKAFEKDRIRPMYAGARGTRPGVKVLRGSSLAIATMRELNSNGASPVQGRL
jgi:hypothetical protein